MYLEHLPQSKDSKESTKQQKEENRKQVSTIVSNYTMSFENRRLDCVIHAKSYFYHKVK